MTQEERDRQIGVHRTHCCLKHGCKYSKKDCPVVWKTIAQDHPCEYCDDEWQSAGMPRCAASGCTKNGRWRWYSLFNVSGVALVQVSVQFYFCDGHDKRHRETTERFNAKPVEERVL